MRTVEICECVLIDIIALIEEYGKFHFRRADYNSLKWMEKSMLRGKSAWVP